MATRRGFPIWGDLRNREPESRCACLLPRRKEGTHKVGGRRGGRRGPTTWEVGEVARRRRVMLSLFVLDSGRLDEVAAQSGRSLGSLRQATFLVCEGRRADSSTSAPDGPSVQRTVSRLRTASEFTHSSSRPEALTQDGYPARVLNLRRTCEIATRNHAAHASFRGGRRGPTKWEVGELAGPGTATPR